MFSHKKVFLQRFVINVPITYHAILKKVIFPLQTVVVIPKNTYNFAHTV